MVLVSRGEPKTSYCGICAVEKRGEVDMNNVKSEPDFDRSLSPDDEFRRSNLAPSQWEVWPKAVELGDNRRSNPVSTGKSGSSILESSADATSLSGSPVCPAPICRQFWKAGNYDDVFSSISRVQNSQNYLHVHPKFLHSNATSHKWAFGAIAELVDNAIDEIQNGATFVIIDKISNARDGNPALLIQGVLLIFKHCSVALLLLWTRPVLVRIISLLVTGSCNDSKVDTSCQMMEVEWIRKPFDASSTLILQMIWLTLSLSDGNGFKTSTMRLGADVIVFSRQLDNRRLTQSIGLLSYTYMSLTGLDRIVVPMVDYEYNMSTSTFDPLHRYGQEHFQSNISILLQWSPYSSELELMKQFDDIGSHGTMVIVYNLWFTDDGNLEFDFESDPEDIRLEGSSILEKVDSRMSVNEEHIGNQYRYSLRVYLSILYLRIPQNFYIILRGKVVQHHNIAQDLKFPEFILYKPQTGGTKEGEVMTTIGFLKEAPHVSIHGFNIYHKNRLVLPFWPVVSYTANRGRGVVGVLEANFVEPIHNKQDFERTSLFQKLESRLKEMTWEDYHCGLIGYHVTRKTRVPISSLETPLGGLNITRDEPLIMSKTSNLVPNPVFNISAGLPAQNTQSSSRLRDIKGMQDDFLLALGRGRRQAREGSNAACAGHSMEIQHATCTARPANRAAVIMENKKLQAKCLQHEKTEQELSYKLSNLRGKLEEAQREYLRMLGELQSLEVVKPDNARRKAL
ncbi:hypothetical protein Cgig2_012742 [Carnegiea gigantea]|uniref:Morc S5 domain-containing protein n=1 Tax=Carnegiea gigantea TaxID=171969 RepID=A0A9Q1KA74_9CARY|nr:hypothetical protein Cgig2_012742 [Carnegiea gigantea]